MDSPHLQLEIWCGWVGQRQGLCHARSGIQSVHSQQPAWSVNHHHATTGFIHRYLAKRLWEKTYISPSHSPLSSSIVFVQHHTTYTSLQLSTTHRHSANTTYDTAVDHRPLRIHHPCLLAPNPFKHLTTFLPDSVLIGGFQVASFNLRREVPNPVSGIPIHQCFQTLRAL